MSEIRTFHITRLLIGALCNFHNRVVQVIEKHGVPGIYIESVFKEYKETLRVLEEKSYRSNAWPNTPRIHAMDEARDFFIRRLFKTAKDYCRSPIDADRLKGESFWHEIAGYEGANLYEMQKEGSVVHALLTQLGDSKYAEYLAETGMDVIVEKIRYYSDRFDEEMDVRSKALLGIERVDVRKVKHRLNALYRSIVKRANAFALLEPTPEIEAFVARMNILVELFRAVANRTGTAGARFHK